MATFLTLLLLAAVTLLAIGLVSPSKFKPYFGERASRGAIAGILGAAIFILLIGISFTDQPTAETDTAKLSSQQTTSSGLSEKDKKAIYYDIVTAEDRAQTEADNKYPTDATAITGLAQEQILERINSNKQLFDELANQYRAEVRKKYGISEEQQKEISAEGSTKMWPVPEL